MEGRKFLQLAQELIAGTEEYHWRAAAIHAYYALVLECRDALSRWAAAVARHQSVHQAVRLKFVYARDTDLNDIGRQLDWLVRRRNDASYNLGVIADFANDAVARWAITRSSNALALLAAIDGDPARRTAAIASLPP
jgi:hypothetical protein